MRNGRKPDAATPRERDALRGVKFCQWGRKMTVTKEEATAKYVSADAVIRRVQALSGIIGRKEFVGGMLSLVLNAEVKLLVGTGYWQIRMC